jgi:mannose-6-phosphate isomerase-like protein (cupin superfamily)
MILPLIEGVAMDVRRVVTGHDTEGKAIFVSDSTVAPFVPEFSPGSAFHLIWGFDEPPHLPDDGHEPDHPRYFPTVGGFRLNFFTLPPAGETMPEGIDVAVALSAMQEALPGLLDHMEPDEPGMHTTATVDVEVVLSGVAELELDDGAKVTLHPGDTVVQNGTRHRWHNPGTEPAVIAVALLGAHHANVHIQ